MLTISEGLKIAVEHDYENNENLGISRADNIKILTKRWLLERKEVLNIINSVPTEEEELGELI